jgi:NADH-quinone oxidoreductase subunit M
MSFPILTSIFLMPLIAVLVIFMIPEKHHKTIKIVSLCFTSISFLLSVWLLINYNVQQAGLQFAEHYEWLPIIGINYFMAVNGINIVLVLLTAIIITGGVLASWNVTNRPKEFFILLLTLTTGVFGVFMAYNLFLFFLFYELAVLPMYLLIGIWGTGKKEYSAMKLTLYLMAGSALIIVGILGLFFASGAHSFDFDVLEKIAFGKTFQIVFFPILFLGFGVLAALWPFHTWSPDGHASAPTAVSMLHAGVLMKLGAYGCLIIPITLLPEGAKFWMPAVAVFATVNIVYGSLGAVAQKDLKYIVAYSSVSHMGIVLLGLAAMNTIAFGGAVLQMFSHGIMTALFFGLVGMIYGRSHTRMIDEQKGLAVKIPVLAVFFVLTGLTSLGLPGLSGFPAELSVFFGAIKVYPVITVICLTAIVITAFYVLRVVQALFFGKFYLKNEIAFGDANKVEITCLTLLSVFIVVIGIYPFYLMNLINSAVAPIGAKLFGG